MLNIDAMTNDQWISYREDKIEKFYASGKILRPTLGCSNCDLGDDYTCFFCECEQIDGGKNE
jgi:hypothetical protein